MEPVVLPVYPLSMVIVTHGGHGALGRVRSLFWRGR